MTLGNDVFVMESVSREDDNSHNLTQDFAKTKIFPGLKGNLFTCMNIPSSVGIYYDWEDTISSIHKAWFFWIPTLLTWRQGIQ